MTRIDLLYAQKDENTLGSDKGEITGEAVWKTPSHPIIAASKLPSVIRSAFTRRSLSFAPSSFQRCPTFLSSPARQVAMENTSKHIFFVQVPPLFSTWLQVLVKAKGAVRAGYERRSN